MTQAEVYACVRTVAAQVGVDPDLAEAICIQESRGSALAYRFEPKWKFYFNPTIFAQRLKLSDASELVLQASSFGPMQIMGSVARELGHNGHLLELVTQPQLAITYSCKKLKGLRSRYDTEAAAIAAYNAGSPMKRLPANTYVNQDYVTAVLGFLSELRQPTKPQGGG